MNQLVTTNAVEERSVAVLQRRPALVPETMGEAMKLAELMAGSTLVPKDLQRKPGDCLMVIQQAIRWDMDPFAVAQECSVIQGKLMYSGKLVAAVVNARGNLSRRLDFKYTGSGDEETVTVSGTLHGESTPRAVSVRFKDARTNAAVWTKQPQQQLAYHGARVWARRHAPELMLGVWSREEFDEKSAAESDQAQEPKAWPTGEVMHPDDYSGGTPEKHTKPPEQKIFPRNPAWMTLKKELDDMVADGVGPVELTTWGSTIEHKIRNWPAEPKREWLKYFAAQMERVVNSAAQIVHEDDGERPATSDDFDHEATEATQSISQRAIAARERAPNLQEIDPLDVLRA